MKSKESIPVADLFEEVVADSFSVLKVFSTMMSQEVTLRSQ